MIWKKYSPKAVKFLITAEFLIFGGAMLVSHLLGLDYALILIVISGLMLVAALPGIGPKQTSVNAMSCAHGMIQPDIQQTEWHFRENLPGIMIAIIPLLVAVMLQTL